MMMERVWKIAEGEPVKVVDSTIETHVSYTLSGIEGGGEFSTVLSDRRNAWWAKRNKTKTLEEQAECHLKISQ